MTKIDYTIRNRIHAPCPADPSAVALRLEAEAMARAESEARRIRSLYSCHRYASEPDPQPRPTDSGAYVPELSERLERDPNLTDGARRCARLIAGYAYRRDREGRTAALTVSYLAKAMGKSTRTVQRYLRQLERTGYVFIAVVLGHRSRLCTGLSIRLLGRLFPRHHRDKWPEKAMKSGMTGVSQNEKKIKKTGPVIWREAWAARCGDGVFRSLMRTQPPPPDFLTT